VSAAAVVVVAFAVLMVVEAIGTATFLVIYMRDMTWRQTAVGRHLAAYSAALLGLLLLTLLAFAVQGAWLTWAILGGHVAFAALIWQRVWLVWIANRR